MAGGSIFRFMLTTFQGSRLFMSGSKTMGRFTYSPDADDLLLMKGLIEAGKVRPVIDKAYPLSEAAEAFRYLGKGHARGRVVVRVA
jgi:NADPH:quinone reductase-like Zn-dependent oxidoreductase